MSGRMALAAGLLATAMATGAFAQDRCEGGLTFYNGKIHTMDAKDTVVSQAAIKDGRFTRVGGLAKLVPGTCVVDLKGKTVVPGLIDNHNHFILLAERPGHDTRLEEAFSVAQLQGDQHQQRADADPGGRFQREQPPGDPAGIDPRQQLEQGRRGDGADAEHDAGPDARQPGAGAAERSRLHA